MKEVYKGRKGNLKKMNGIWVEKEEERKGKENSFRWRWRDSNNFNFFFFFGLGADSNFLTKLEGAGGAIDWSWREICYFVFQLYP